MWTDVSVVVFVKMVVVKSVLCNVYFRRLLFYFSTHHLCYWLFDFQPPRDWSMEPRGWSPAGWMVLLLVKALQEFLTHEQQKSTFCISTVFCDMTPVTAGDLCSVLTWKTLITEVQHLDSVLTSVCSSLLEAQISICHLTEGNQQVKKITSALKSVSRNKY